MVRPRYSYSSMNEDSLLKSFGPGLHLMEITAQDINIFEPNVVVVTPKIFGVVESPTFLVVPPNHFCDYDEDLSEDQIIESLTRLTAESLADEPDY